MQKKTFIWRFFIIALILRIIPAVLTRSLGIGLDDMFQYDMLARSLASGNGFRWYACADLQRLEPYVNFDLSTIDYDPVRGVPTSFRAPLYPGLLALIYYLTGAGAGRFFATRLVQAVLGALLAPLTYKISCRLFPDRESDSVISAWIVACYPMLVIYPIGLATENLFFLLVLASFYFLLAIPDSRPSTRYPILAGFFLALAALTRSVILPFAGLAIVWVWIILKNRRAAIIIVAIMFILLTPWGVRNSLLHQKLTFIETSMGYNLYVGYHPDSDGAFTVDASLDLLSILDDAQRDQVGTQKAIEFIRAAPERFLPLALNRLGYFFTLEKRALVYFYSNNLLGYIPRPLLLFVSSVLLLPFVFVAGYASLGLTLTRPHTKTILLYGLLVAYILPHVLILSEDRFHLTLVPFFAMLAAQTWTSGPQAFMRRWHESTAGKVAVILAVCVVLLLFLNWGFELSRDADKIIALFSPNGNQLYYPY